ncbi:MAG: SPOR domain-containing protein [Pseudomonadota bacterium]
MTNDMIRKQMGVGADQTSSEADDGAGLPWLEPAPEPERGTLSFKSLALIGTVFLLVFAALLGVFYNRIAGTQEPSDGTGNTPAVIAAPDGPYKISPDEDARRDLAYAEPEKIGPPKFAAETERPMPEAEQLEADSVAAAPQTGGSDKDLADNTNSEPEIDDSASAPRPQKDVETKVIQVKPPEPKAAAVRAVTSESAKMAASGGYMLQLGAFSTRDSAMNGWNIISAKFPGSLSGLSANVEAFETSSSKTLYRLRAASVETRNQANVRCASLKAAKQPCFVVSPQ